MRAKVNPVVLVAVPPALRGCETITLDAPCGTNLDNHMCVFRRIV